jgi:hypothetical protein
MTTEKTYPHWVQREPHIGAVLCMSADEEKQLLDDWAKQKAAGTKQRAREAQAAAEAAKQEAAAAVAAAEAAARKAQADAQAAELEAELRKAEQGAAAAAKKGGK